MKINFSKGVAVLGDIELTFSEMGVLERALNTALEMSEESGEILAIGELADKFGVELSSVVENAEIDELGEGLEVEPEADEFGAPGIDGTIQAAEGSE